MNWYSCWTPCADQIFGLIGLGWRKRAHTLWCRMSRWCTTNHADWLLGWPRFRLCWQHLLVSLQKQWNMQVTEVRPLSFQAVYAQQRLLNSPWKEETAEDICIMKMNYHMVYWGSDTLQFVLQPAWATWDNKPQCAPLCSAAEHKKLEHRSLCSGPFCVRLNRTQHGFGFSACSVFVPWSAFCASDLCPTSSEHMKLSHLFTVLVQSLVLYDYHYHQNPTTCWL